jgi:SNF2 family DNA or RNA helicase
MPETAYEVRTTSLSAKAAKAYRQMERQLMAEIGQEGSADTTVLLAPNHMVKYTRLLQLANASCEINADGDVTMTDPSDKLDLFMDTLEDVGEPVIAWFSSVKLLKLAEARLEKAGIPHVTIHGETAPKKRQEAVEAFQRGDVDLILLNPAAGGEGITLTRARVSIWVMRPASSIQNSQADDRNNRYGVEHSELLCIDLVAEGTIEEQALERLATKRTALQEVVG